MKKKKNTPLKAIRVKCLDCCFNSSKEVQLCPVKGCSLHEFRFGKNPYQKKNLTESAKRVLREQFSKNLSK
ncbi:MAG: hypothetical protein N4A44_04665 [Alphaproteobacteria bacterium]|jgi:hypothetical protein|nr:hypothetical protein [Alphaproteobacteria bacterium]